jgi:hypothetical protein
LNINSAVEGFPVAPGSKMLLTVYYLSVVNFKTENGKGYVV